MNFKEMKTLLNNVITNEFNHVQTKSFEDMDNLKEYKKISDDASKILELLTQNLSKQDLDLVDNLQSKIIEQMCLESRYYFKEGVRAGMTNLNFLADSKIINWL